MIVQVIVEHRWAVQSAASCQETSRFLVGKRSPLWADLNMCSQMIAAECQRSWRGKSTYCIAHLCFYSASHVKMQLEYGLVQVEWLRLGGDSGCLCRPSQALSRVLTSRLSTFSVHRACISWDASNPLIGDTCLEWWYIINASSFPLVWNNYLDHYSASKYT